MEFLGDIFLDKAYNIDIELKNYIFNLEYPLSCDGKPAKGKVNLCQNKSFIEETFERLPLAVCLANNHIMDYGEEAFSKTISYLNTKNIKYFGAGNRGNNFNNPCKLKLNDKNIVIFGYSCPFTHPVFGTEHTNGSALLEEEEIINDIKKVRDSVDFIVLQLHWGDEEIRYPKPEDVRKARLLVDNGADLIVGHHAHVVQSHEVYKGKNIYYGIGNFIFPDLNVLSFYDGKQFNGQYLKEQNNLNRQSLVVRLDDDFGITHKATFFDDKSVTEQDFTIPTWIPKNKKSYLFYYKFWIKKEMIKSFLKKPRLPNLDQIRYFFKSQKDF